MFVFPGGAAEVPQAAARIGFRTDHPRRGELRQTSPGLRRAKRGEAANLMLCQPEAMTFEQHEHTVNILGGRGPHGGAHYCAGLVFVQAKPRPMALRFLAAAS